MIEILKYKTRDGREFSDIPTAREHEQLLDQIDAIMAALDVPPTDCGWVNGGGYLQHNPVNAQRAKRRIIHLWDGEERIKQDAERHPAHWSILTRILSDSNSPLQDPWYRFVCMDDEWREWGQPFFARNPGQGEQIRLNP